MLKWISNQKPLRKSDLKDAQIDLSDVYKISSSAHVREKTLSTASTESKTWVPFEFFFLSMHHTQHIIPSTKAWSLLCWC